jgi:hypothetical protein
VCHQARHTATGGKALRTDFGDTIRLASMLAAVQRHCSAMSPLALAGRGRGANENGNQPHATDDYGPGTGIHEDRAAIWGEDARWARVQVASGQESEALSDMHGGAVGSVAPKGKGNGRYTTGPFTKDMLNERQTIREIVAETRELMRRIG